MRQGQDSMSTVLTFTIVLLVIIISLGVILTLREMFSGTDEDAQCATQIAAHMAIVGSTKELVAPDISCPTKRQVLEVDGPQAANPEIAKAMADCWRTWQRGEVQLFGEQEGIYCHVCSVIWIDGTDKVEGLAPYLQVGTMKDGRTYAQYLSNQVSGSYFEESQLPPPTSSLPTEMPLGVIFYYAKGQAWQSRLYNDIIGQPGTGAAAGTILAIGVVATAGASIPVIIFAGVAGGAAGGIASLFSRDDLSYMAAVVVRPVDERRIADLGCTYAPVENR